MARGFGVFRVALSVLTGCGGEATEMECSLGAVGVGECPEGMVHIPDSNCCIDGFEASIDDSGAARSVRGVLPAVEVTWYEARAACEAAGKTLCPLDVWWAACSGGGARTYPYGDEYDSTACNGRDEDGEEETALTGTFERCEGGYPGIFDMSANVAEWAAPCVRGEFGCPALGGTYINGRVDVVCVLDLFPWPFVADGRSAAIGFRCCAPL